MEPNNTISIQVVFATVIVAIAIIIGCPAARASYGYTYAQSCKEWGGKGIVDQKEGCIVWYVRDSTHTHTWMIIERCSNNRCVMVDYVGQRYIALPESVLWGTLSQESVQPWRESPQIGG